MSVYEYMSMNNRTLTQKFTDSQIFDRFNHTNERIVDKITKQSEIENT